MWSWKQSALLPAPLLLLATTYLCYQVLERRFGARHFLTPTNGVNWLQMR